MCLSVRACICICIWEWYIQICYEMSPLASPPTINYHFWYKSVLGANVSTRSRIHHGHLWRQTTHTNSHLRVKRKESAFCLSIFWFTMNVCVYSIDIPDLAIVVVFFFLSLLVTILCFCIIRSIIANGNAYPKTTQQSSSMTTETTSDLNSICCSLFHA